MQAVLPQYHCRIFYIILSLILILKYYTEYLYTNAYRLGLTGQSWSKWLLWLPKNSRTLKNRLCWTALAGFQISHTDGLKSSSHNHHIFYVH